MSILLIVSITFTLLGIAFAIFIAVWSFKFTNLRMERYGELFSGIVTHKSNPYRAFAEENGYSIADPPRILSANVIQFPMHSDNSNDPLVKNYASFSHYPFGRGKNQLVAYLTSGYYKKHKFFCYTYRFHDGSDKIFGVVLLNVDRAITKDVSENTFFEGGFLCHYNEGFLDVNAVKADLDKLIVISS